MLSFNWPIILATGILPLLMAMVYFHPQLMGNLALRHGVMPTALMQDRKPLFYVYGVLLGMLLAVFFVPVVFHVNHLFSLIALPGGPPPEGSEALSEARAFVEKYGQNFRTVKHGVFHGVLTVFFGVWPILGMTAFLERKKWQFTGIWLGYWLLLFAIMGGVINGFGL
jgi:Protein of unknown function (DUF1761)